MTGARRPPWRIGRNFFGKECLIFDEQGREIGSFYDPDDAALVVSAVNREHNAAGAEPVAWWIVEVPGDVRPRLFCGSNKADEQHVEWASRQAGYTVTKLFSAPVAACPEPAGEVEWLVPADMLDELRRIWSAYPEGCWIPKALTDLHNARAALARRPAEGWLPCLHSSDCALHNAPALPIGKCDCWLSKYDQMLIAGGTISCGDRGDMPSTGITIAEKVAYSQDWISGEHDGEEVLHRPKYCRPLPAPPRDEGGER